MKNRVFRLQMLVSVLLLVRGEAMSKAISLAVVLVISILSAATGRAGGFERSRAVAGKDFAAFAAAGAQARIPDGRLGLNEPRPAMPETGPREPKAVELFCSVGKLELAPKDGTRYNATVNDARMTKSLRELAAKLPGGEQSLVNVTFTDRSFVVADLQKVSGTANYDAGQFAPKLNMLSGGRATLLLTYFRMNSGQSDDYKEVVSLGFSGCAK